jgi:hypothetical protein
MMASRGLGTSRERERCCLAHFRGPGAAAQKKQHCGTPFPCAAALSGSLRVEMVFPSSFFLSHFVTSTFCCVCLDPRSCKMQNRNAHNTNPIG